jgi:hypothetical protein
MHLSSCLTSVWQAEVGQQTTANIVMQWLVFLLRIQGIPVSKLCMRPTTLQFSDFSHPLEAENWFMPYTKLRS